jgi:para-aminobenzoate synthetase/4-amino-4-deoxychorismate lyase
VHIARAPDAFDILLWNERDELTEFTRGNVVISLAGKLLTPSASCGLLPGVLRAELLEQGVIREATILRVDLTSAEAIWFINSVRGWLPAEIIPA